MASRIRKIIYIVLLILMIIYAAVFFTKVKSPKFGRVESTTVKAEKGTTKDKYNFKVKNINRFDSVVLPKYRYYNVCVVSKDTHFQNCAINALLAWKKYSPIAFNLVKDQDKANLVIVERNKAIKKNAKDVTLAKSDYRHITKSGIVDSGIIYVNATAIKKCKNSLTKVIESQVGLLLTGTNYSPSKNSVLYQNTTNDQKITWDDVNQVNKMQRKIIPAQ